MTVPEVVYDLGVRGEDGKPELVQFEGGGDPSQRGVMVRGQFGLRPPRHYPEADYTVRAKSDGKQIRVEVWR